MQRSRFEKFLPLIAWKNSFQMDNSAEYWRRAQAAFQQARQATNGEDRTAWLQIAEGFEALFRLVQREQEAHARDLSDHDFEEPDDQLH